MVFEAVCVDVVPLSMDPFGNYLIQKLVQYGTVEQRISLGGKPGLRGLATYRVDPATGYFSYDFTSIKATVFGREVAVPGFVVDKSSSFIDTSYFDGTLWVERFFAQGPDGPSSKDPVAYNCWRREKGE